MGKGTYHIDHYCYVDGEFWDRVSDSPQQVAKSLDAVIFAVWDKKGIGGYTDKEVRLGVKPITYHRQPTPSEIKRGYGDTHYKDFEPSECRKDDYTIKQWVKCPYDGLRYYK